MAVDATDVKAWANSFKPDTDPDAGIGAKKKGHLFYWNGYKVHLAVDADSELPIWFDVTAANTYDGHSLAPVLKDATQRFDWFKPQYVTADKGYNSKEVFRSVAEDFGAVPIIDVTKANRREARECEAYPEQLGEVTVWHCEREPYEPFCPHFGHCPKNQSWMLPRTAEKAKRAYFERYSPFPFGSAEWKAVYNKRVSVERAFSRLKGHRKLNALRTRRMPKVWLHIAMSLLAMLANAAAQVRTNAAFARRCI